MNQGTMLTGTTQMPTGQLIYLQPPSSAAKVMGIIIIIYGLLQGLGLLGLFVEPVDPMTGEIIEYPAAAKAMDGLSSLAGLVGFVAAGVFLTDFLPEEGILANFRLENLTVWIMNNPVTAGNRAIMIGIALGTASVSLKILLGVDRSYLGGGD